MFGYVASFMKTGFCLYLQEMSNTAFKSAYGVVFHLVYGLLRIGQIT